MISRDQFEQQWLAEILDGTPSTTAKGNRFAEKILRDWHEIDSATSEIILCDGAGDGGIDAAVFLKEDPAEGIEGDCWMLVQSKFGTAFSGADTIGIEAQKLFATLEGKRERLSSLSTELVQRLRTFLQNKGPKDRLEFVLATNRKLTPEEVEYLQNVKTLGQCKFGECFEVDSVSIETIYNRLAEAEAPEDNKARVVLATRVASSDENLLIGATTLPAIFRFMQQFKSTSGDLDLLYEKNVRKFLGNKRKVNKGIERTIEEYPERFGLYNNGVTIVAEAVNPVDTALLELVNPYVVNRCQTTRSIWSVLQRKLNAGGSAPTEEQIGWQKRLEKAVVVTKIVVVGAGGEELLTETTRYTNSQNAVSEKDFIALEKDFRNWAPRFNAQYGVFLEIQRGAWEARNAFQKQNPTTQPYFHDCANAFELLKAYAAGWLSEPGIAYGKNAPFAPGGTLFDRMVKEPDFGVESLYAAFQLQQESNRHGFGRGAKRPTRGQTRYLFMMVAIDLVKDFLVNNRLSFTHKDISKAVIAFSESDILKQIGDAAVQLIDEYLTDGNEDSLFSEPEYVKSKDLNAILKSDKLGKGEEFFPRLKTQIALAKKMFRKTAPIPKMLAALDAEGWHCLPANQTARRRRAAIRRCEVSATANASLDDKAISQGRRPTTCVGRRRGITGGSEPSSKLRTHIKRHIGYFVSPSTSIWPSRTESASRTSVRPWRVWGLREMRSTGSAEA
jgi:hypothetical protein